MKKLLIGVNIIIIAITAWKFNSFPEEVPLYYSRPWGDEQIGEIWHIVLLPILMNFIYFANMEITRRFFQQDQKIVDITRKFTMGLVMLFAFIYLRIIFLVT